MIREFFSKRNFVVCCKNKCLWSSIVKTFQAAFQDKVPVKELITTEQIADFVRYLCFSVTSPMMTGTAYLLDGGYTAL